MSTSVAGFNDLIINSLFVRLGLIGCRATVNRLTMFMGTIFGRASDEMVSGCVRE